MYVGDFTKVIMGVRTEAEIAISTEADEAFDRN